MIFQRADIFLLSHIKALAKISALTETPCQRRVNTFSDSLCSPPMPPVDLDHVVSFSAAADALLAAVARSHERSTIGLIERAIRQGAIVKLTYVASTGIVSVDLLHKNGNSNVLFAAQVEDDDDIDDALGYGGSALARVRSGRR